MTNATYFIAETANGWVNNPAKWEPINARTLTAAKRAAAGAQMFQGTAVFVGQVVDGRVTEVAVKRDDAINMNIKGRWACVS